MTLPSGRPSLRRHTPPSIYVRPAAPGDIDNESATFDSEKPADKRRRRFRPKEWNWPSRLSWVPGKLNWAALKIVIRCAIASWIVPSGEMFGLLTVVVFVAVLHADGGFSGSGGVSIYNCGIYSASR
jgi:hypothetical protein